MKRLYFVRNIKHRKPIANDDKAEEYKEINEITDADGVLSIEEEVIPENNFRR